MCWFSPEWTARLGFNEAIWCKLYDLKSMLASLFHLQMHEFDPGIHVTGAWRCYVMMTYARLVYLHGNFSDYDDFPTYFNVRLFPNGSLRL